MYFTKDKLPKGWETCSQQLAELRTLDGNTFYFLNSLV